MEWTNYKAVALIDWLMLRIEFQAPTQRQWVQKELRRLLSLPEDAPEIWVQAIKPKAGGVASAFLVVLHDTPANDMNLLEHIVDSLGNWHLIESTSVEAIEVAIDIYPSAPDHNSVLTREATRALQTRFAGYGNNPRQYDPETGTTPMLADRPGVIDQCTFYVGNHRGHHKDPICARIYNKVTDHNQKSIPASEHRARAEITLQHGAPARLGITDIASLKAFPFDSLTEHFHFRRIKEDLSAGSKLQKDAQEKAGNTKQATFLNNLAQLTDKLLKEHGGEHVVGWPFGWVRQNPGHGSQPRRTHSRHTEPDKSLNAKIYRALRILLK